MPDFAACYEEMNRDSVREHLLSLTEPCYESTLLRIAFPDLRITEADPLALYRSHFVLFHYLYELQEAFCREGRYLYVHFMRTFLSDYPAAGTCRFYEEMNGSFCGAECREDRIYCDFHGRLSEENALDELSSKYFYLDAQNYRALNEKTAAGFLAGSWELLNHYDEYRASIKILDLHGTPDIRSVKLRFREMARIHHPDMGAESHEKFNEINRAYQLLMRLIPAMESTRFSEIKEKG